MSGSPSRRRREGREAYSRGGDPHELCKYTYEWDRNDWLEGWSQEEAIDKVRQAEEADARMRMEMSIDQAIDMADCSESVREILRRIAEHAGVE